MDVSAVGQAAAPAVAVSTGSTGGTAGPTPAPVRPSAPPMQASAQPPAPADGKQAQENKSAIAPAIAKLFGDANPPEPIRLDVSYRVLRDPNEIVTVFSDPKTGQEVAQFPPEILVQIAQFFDQQRGATLDRNA
jgi:uncharacterized FlaG/YvyC family protein